MRTLTRIKQSLASRLGVLVRLQRFLYRFKPYRAKFRAYYLDQGWGDLESVSGPGSTLDATREIRKRVPALFKELKIRSVVDVACGDFNWMKTVNLEGIDYRGYDIVPELIAANTVKYGRDHVSFGCIDIVKDELPRADLILCRDCLIHYPDRHVIEIIWNMKRSGSTYLLTTTFTEQDRNEEIETVGRFRRINLEKPPFGFPRPLALIEEGTHRGKSLGLWRLGEIPLRP